MDDGEVWAAVADTEGLYEVSTLGRVRRTQEMRRGTLPAGGIIACNPNKYGYLMFNTVIRGRSYSRALHVVVAEAFLGPRPPGFHCAHLNGQKDDPRLKNLAWVTPKENNAHKVGHGTAQRGEKNPRAKLTVSQIREIRGSTETNGEIAERFGLNLTHVSDIRRGACWKHVAADLVDSRRKALIQADLRRAVLVRLQLLSLFAERADDHFPAGELGDRRYTDAARRMEKLGWVSGRRISHKVKQYAITDKGSDLLARLLSDTPTDLPVEA